MKTLIIKNPLDGKSVTIEFKDGVDCVITTRSHYWRDETFDEYMQLELKEFEKDFNIISLTSHR